MKCSNIFSTIHSIFYRVKSGKVRKQCELCGEWSNIKWFFKHMSEVHQVRHSSLTTFTSIQRDHLLYEQALFCRCCREYLPIHEHEEHKKWHAQPPYMGQKIRLEGGRPVIVDRKERASLTPIGSLAAWGGSSGGKVVKAVDMGPVTTVKGSGRKRKAPAAAAAVATEPDNGPSPSMVGRASVIGSLGANEQLIGHLDYGSGEDVSASRKSSPAASISQPQAAVKDTLMPKETCPVCGIQITYKNLARHIKLRHKIRYKFCHRCRKLVPSPEFEKHRAGCVSVNGDVGEDLSGGDDANEGEDSTRDGEEEEDDEVIGEVACFPRIEI